MAASSSTAAFSNKNHLYEVFINHCGVDAKETFARSLYLRLLDHGLRPFLDNHEMQPGYGISSQTINAIRTASVHVAIFSARYAESTWCLDLLLKMLESKAPIIPVFYGVTPSEVRWTRGKGIYVQALQGLAQKTDEGRPRYDCKTIENWRNALSQVAQISGFDLKKCDIGHDKGYLLDEVVRSVLKKTEFIWRAAARNRVGLDEKVKEFENKVFLGNHQSAKPQVVGIVGLGGVGKTTLAKELFDRRKLEYGKFCFLSNVREKARQGFLNSLQSQLLKIMTGSDVLINSIDEGIAALKKHLTSYRVFVILDDVDHLNQIDALLPVRTDLLTDSLVLITSRDEKVIRSSGVENASIYQLTGLNDQHSRELFCAYAFNRLNRPRRFKSLVDNFLEACDGLPLFLKVFGALLYGKDDNIYGKDDKSDLEDLLDRLPVLSGERQEKLQISYQSLDMEQQQIFLDTACFFIGQKRDTAIRIWEGSGWNGRLGFQTLQNRCLLEVDIENNIEMHDHLRDFGKAC